MLVTSVTPRTVVWAGASGVVAPDCNGGQHAEEIRGGSTQAWPLCIHLWRKGLSRLLADRGRAHQPAAASVGSSCGAVPPFQKQGSGSLSVVCAPLDSYRLDPRGSQHLPGGRTSSRRSSCSASQKQVLAYWEMRNPRGCAKRGCCRRQDVHGAGPQQGLCCPAVRQSGGDHAGFGCRRVLAGSGE